MTTTLLTLAVLAAVVLLGLGLAKVLGRLLFGAGPTSSRELRRRARAEGWTHGPGSGG